MRVNSQTCYLNSIVQCLVGVPQLVAYFKSDVFAERIAGIREKAEEGTSKREKHKGLVALEFSRLLEKLATSKESFEPVDFLAMLQKVSNLFEEGVQHDSQEFLNWLLDNIHEGWCLLTYACRYQYGGCKAVYRNEGLR
jgi:ubiquitin C-terminal hydrolase